MTHPSLFGDGELPEAWSVAAGQPARQERGRGHLPRVGLGARRAGGVQGLAKRALVLHPPRRRRLPPLRALEAAGGSASCGGSSRLPTDGMEVLVRGRPTLWEEKGEYRLTASDIVPTALRRGQGARTRAGARGAARPTDSSIPPGSARCPPLAAPHRRGHQPRRRRAARHHHRHPEALERRRAGGGRRPGAGRGRGGVAGAAPSAWSTGFPAWTSASSAGAAEPRRTSPRSTPSRCAARSPRCGCRPSPPSGTRPTSRWPTSWPMSARRRRRPPRRWSVPERSTLLQRVDGFGVRLAAGLRAPHPRRRGAARAHRRPHAGRPEPAGRGAAAAGWSASAAQLEALSPLRVLARGYSVAQDDDGRVLKRVADFPPGRPSASG